MFQSKHYKLMVPSIYFAKLKKKKYNCPLSRQLQKNKQAEKWWESEAEEGTGEESVCFGGAGKRKKRI